MKLLFFFAFLSFFFAVFVLEGAPGRSGHPAQARGHLKSPRHLNNAKFCLTAQAHTAQTHQAEVYPAPNREKTPSLPKAFKKNKSVSRKSIKTKDSKTQSQSNLRKMGLHFFEAGSHKKGSENNLSLKCRRRFKNKFQTQRFKHKRLKNKRSKPQVHKMEFKQKSVQNTMFNKLKFQTQQVPKTKGHKKKG